MHKPFIDRIAEFKDSLLFQAPANVSNSIDIINNQGPDLTAVCGISPEKYRFFSLHMVDTNSYGLVNRWLITQLKDILAVYHKNPEKLDVVLDRTYGTLELYISRNMKNVTKFIDRIKAIDEQLQLEVTSIGYIDNLKKLESFKNFRKAYQKALVRTQLEVNI